MADGCDAPDDALHRSDDGGVAGQLSRARCHTSAAGNFGFDFGSRPIDQSKFHDIAALSANHVSTGTMDRQRVGAIVVHIDDRAAIGGLGHVVRGPLSDHYVRPSAFAANSTGEPDAFRYPAQSTHDSCLSSLLHISCPPQRCAVSHIDHS